MYFLPENLLKKKVMQYESHARGSEAHIALVNRLPSPGVPHHHQYVHMQMITSY